MNCKMHEIIKNRLINNNIQFKSCDNISEYIYEGEIDKLIVECTEIFQKLLDVLIIDSTDDNLKDTPKRMANMYIKEIFSGRYFSRDIIKKFPVSNNYTNNNNIFLIKTKLNSTCCHHFLPIKCNIYIGIIFNNNNDILGLSKYHRLCNWCSKRAILQEEFILILSSELKKYIINDDFAIYIDASHDCCNLRGIECDNFSVANMFFSGIFKNNESIKKSFFDLIILQQK